MSAWRLRTRMLAAYAGLIILGFLIIALLAGRQIAAGASEDYATALNSQVVAVAQGLSEPLEHYLGGELAAADLQTAVNEYSNALGMEVLLVGPRGEPLSGSGPLPDHPLDHDPELAAALRGQIAQTQGTGPTGERLIYVAAPLLAEGRLLGAVRVSAPGTALEQAVLQRRLALGGGVLLLTALAIGVALALADSLARPLDDLQQAAAQIAQGDFSGRLPEERQDEFGELARTFNHMTAQVEAMLAEQKAFAGNASHELRTPLTAIRVRSEALREGRLDEETARQYVIEIDDEAARMGRLIQDLLLLSRFESGRAEPEQTPQDPARLARAVTQSLDHEAQARGITILLDAPPDLPPIAAGGDHAQVVFRNVLENALKYGRAGGEVRWSLRVEGDELASVVVDDGQGVAAEDLDHLLERFYRADKAHTRATSGVGLGLALAQAICELYGGRIGITSPGPGLGTTVTVWWPLAEGEPDAGGAA